MDEVQVTTIEITKEQTWEVHVKGTQLKIMTTRAGCAIAVTATP